MVHKLLWRRLVIVWSIFTALATITFTYLGVTKVFDGRLGLRIIFNFLIPICYSVLCIFTTMLRAAKKQEKDLKAENSYKLGVEIPFFNFAAFSTRVEELVKKPLPNKRPYLIAFTTSDYASARNFSRSSDIVKYSGYVAQDIQNYFLKQTNGKFNNAAFCYYFGSFLIYIYADDLEIHNLIDYFEQRLYEIMKENQIRTYVKPFFGVAKIDNPTKESLLVSLDHALIARSNAEHLFVTAYYYRKDSSYEKNMSDADAIKYGLANNEFVVFYQPKFSLKSKHFISSEALVRWESSKYGALLPPSQFIGMAETNGLIHEIDSYVFERVCQDLNEAKRKGRRILPVSINYSTSEFFDDSFIDNLVYCCHKYLIPTSLIEIEITETTSQVNSFITSSVIAKLKDKGFRVLMDDFGTGYSNITNLMNIPFDAVKLDRSYIMKIATDEKSRELVKLLINVCHVNDMEVIAEGVDNIDEVNILKKLGCDTIQGFFYSKPVCKEEYEKFIGPEGNSFEDRKAGK